MKILITCAGFPPAYLGGGPIRTIAAMCANAGDRHDVYVLTNNFDHGSTARLVEEEGVWNRYGKAQVLYAGHSTKGLVRSIAKGLKIKPDVLYLNGLFYFRLSILVHLLARARREAHIAIAPRGELDPGALALKAKKKMAFLRIMNSTGLLRRAIWHASSDMEAENIRRAVNGDPVIIVRENDTLLPRRASRSESQSTERLSIVFMSRVARKKGLHTLLQSLRLVDNEMTLDIIGPFEDQDYVKECQSLIDAMPQNVSVRFLGPIEPTQTRNILAGYDLMAFPTAGENFGHVIAESLSVGCPVMCTDATPWTDRLNGGGGMVLDSVSPAKWSQEIDEYAAKGPIGWTDSRRLAAEAYDRWQNESAEPHFFDLLEEQIK